MVAVKEFSWEEISGPDFGDPARQAWREAVAQVEAQLCAKLRVEVLPERQRKALELVRADAVTLHADGSAIVQSGQQTYTLAPDCSCADAKHRTELCKHTLAVELHRRAVALFHGTNAAPVPTSSATPAAPSTSQAVAGAGSAQRARVPGVGRARSAGQRLLQVPRREHGAALHAARH